jgi:predicted membrane protein
VIFHERTFRGHSGDSKEYNAVFGKAVVDLRDIELKEKVTRIKVSAVFGSADVILNEATPVRIKADAVFGGVQLPENITGAFGTSTYQSKNFNENQNYLMIEAASVFAGIVIHYQ